MRILPIAMALCLAAATTATTAAAQDFNWHGRIAQGKRLEVKGVNGDVRAVLASGAEASVNATKHSRRSDPDEVEIKVVESEDGITICAVYPTPRHARQENSCEPGDRWHSSTEDNDVTVDFEVRVPAGVEFDGKTVNGEMSAEGLKADVHASTVNDGPRRSFDGQWLGVRGDGPRELGQRARVQHRERRHHADHARQARHRSPGQHRER